jgi:transposase-like protein
MGAKITEKSDRDVAKKIDLVVESWGLRGERLGRFLRAKGLYFSEIEHWREQLKRGLEKDHQMSSDSKRYYKAEIKKLKRELAEARVIIEVQKKVHKILEGEGKSTQGRKGKKS